MSQIGPGTLIFQEKEVQLCQMTGAYRLRPGVTARSFDKPGNIGTVFRDEKADSNKIILRLCA